MQNLCWIWAYGIGKFQLELDSLSFCNHIFYNLPASCNFTDLDVKDIFQDSLTLDYSSKPGANHKRPIKNLTDVVLAVLWDTLCSVKPETHFLTCMQTHTHTELRGGGTR